MDAELSFLDAAVYCTGMATTVDDAFTQFCSRLTPSTTETTAAASHRVSLEQVLRSNFGMTNFFRSGSFGYGTSVSGYSDVDYFAVVPPDRLHQNSADSLRAFETVLQTRFPNTGVFVDAPAVVTPFGTSRSERHEIIPAHAIQSAIGYKTYGIPDRAGGWLISSPEAYAAYVDRIDQRLGGKVKNLIRLVKAWKYYTNTPMRSFYLEMRVAEFAATQSSIVYRFDVAGALKYLSDIGLANMADPCGLSGTIYACFTSEMPTALANLRTAASSAAAAQTAQLANQTATAFQHWDRVYANQFPGYY